TKELPPPSLINTPSTDASLISCGPPSGIVVPESRSTASQPSEITTTEPPWAVAPTQLAGASTVRATDPSRSETLARVLPASAASFVHVTTWSFETDP